MLDVGCGDGKFTGLFLPYVGQVVGVDSSPSMIESANKDYGGEKAGFRVLDCCYLEQDKGVADYIHSALCSKSTYSQEQHQLTTLRIV